MSERERSVARSTVRACATLALTSLMACGGSGDNPAGPGGGSLGFATQTVTDPTGDTFNTGGMQWDLTAFTVSRDSGGITVKLDFASDVLSPMSGDTSAIIGYVDLDLDQNAATGDNSVVDALRHGVGSTALGVDATIDFTLFATDSTVLVYDSLARVTGRVKPAFVGRSITIRVPRAMIGNDDGFVNAAAIVGSTRRPTDFVPQSGHLTLGPESLVTAPARTAAASAPGLLLLHPRRDAAPAGCRVRGALPWCE